MIGRFETPPVILTGIGCVQEVGKIAKPLGKRALLVTGSSAMRRHGILDKVTDLLQKEGVAVTLFSGVEHDPSLETVDRVRHLANEAECDLVMGLGGGSAIDAAKAAAGLAFATEPTRVYYDGKPLPSKGLPVIAIPSTFGTGSEATRVSVLSDPSRKLKKSIRHDCMLPKAAIVDPEIGRHAPPEITAACGMDALTQAIESFFSIYATNLTQAMSFHAVVLLISGLPQAFRNGEDLEARSRCADGALMAGIALHNARLGLVHGLAHPLGARTGLPHGYLCGVLLPHVLRYNREAAGERYAVFSRLFEEDMADFVENLLVSLHLPTQLTGVTFSSEERDAIVVEVLASGSTQANPRPVTKADVEDLLKKICG